MREVESTVREVVSLDVPLGDEDEEMAEEFIPDETIPTPEREALRELFRQDLLELVGQLPDRDALVLRMRYGLEGTPPQTLAAIGKALGISRERVRQIEQRALSRLKKAWGKEELEFYRRLIAD